MKGSGGGVHASLLTNHRPADKRAGRGGAVLRLTTLAALLLVSVLGARAEENLATINFNNRVLADNVSAPVFEEAVGGQLVEGEAYCAQLYGGPVGTPENRLLPTGDIVDFRTGLAAGFVNVGSDGTRKVPGVAPGEPAVVQIRAWSTSGGATYDEARANPDPNSKVGRSPPLVVNTESGVLALPVSMIGLQSFALRHQEMPPPGIERGVSLLFVTWPIDASTYQVEQAPTPQGPWQIINRNAQLHNGRYRIPVTSTNQTGFFRLRLQ